MKTNFNIEKNVRNSRSISALSALRKLQSLGLLLCALLFGSLQVWGDTKTDIMFAKGFGGYTTNSFSGAGTDYTAVANSTNATSVTYAMSVFNGSTGAVRGNQSGASSNYSCRNTTTKDGYYISSVSLTITGSGTYGLDGGTNGRSLVYFGSSAYSNPSTANPSGTATTASPSSSGQTTLTWTNSDESASYFILYHLKTSGTCLCSNATYSLQVVWTQKSGPSTFTVTIAKNQNSWGTVSQASVTSVANNTSISADGATLTVGSTTVTASPAATDANYTYAFNNWTGIPAGGKVTADVTVTANFTRTARQLTNYRTSCVACEEPTSVSITGTNKYLGGQTISLTATPTGGTGTPSYQWQKKISGVWTDIDGATSANLQISSCTHANSGGYRCIVSTGEGCETKSHADNTDGYGVHVFSIHGK